MPIYAFGIDTNQSGGDIFDSVGNDHRSDMEQRHTLLAVHNPTNNDLKTARALAEEMINVSGAEIKLYIRTDNADYDKLWDADPDPTYWNPIPIKAFFKPQPLELELKKWGADSVNKTELVFSHLQLFRLFNDRMVRVGDVVQIPYNSAVEGLNPKYYRIVNASPSGNYRYNWLYFNCQIEALTADMTVRPDDASPLPAENLMEQRAYRESI